eukprot:7155975-Prymnesium_polylepis.1
MMRLRSGGWWSTRHSGMVHTHRLRGLWELHGDAERDQFDALSRPLAARKRSAARISQRASASAARRGGPCARGLRTVKICYSCNCAIIGRKPPKYRQNFAAGSRSQVPRAR